MKIWWLIQPLSIYLDIGILEYWSDGILGFNGCYAF
jgi:hypothetical protein